MFRVSSLLLLVMFISPSFAQRQFGFDNRVSSGQPYLSPAESVKRMKVPEGFNVRVAAAEPAIVNPIACCFDPKGRLWIVECFEYPKRTPKGKAPRDRVKVLEDTNGDGVFDKVTVFAEGKDFPVPPERAKAGLGAFDMASGIEYGYGGVFLGAPPYLWFLKDTNGDGKADSFEVLLSGFGSQDTHETLNTFQWGPDGKLYGLHGIFTHSEVKGMDGPPIKMNAAVWRYDVPSKKFEIFSEGTSNPWGMDYRNSDGQFVLACCVIPHLYHMVPGGIYRRQAGSSFNPYAFGELREICDHTFHKESGWAHAGLISLDTPDMPEQFKNSVIFGSIHGCSIKQNVLKRNGSTYVAQRGDDFLISGDKNFRPINLRWGPDGAIYCIDWHDQNPCHQASPDSWDYERGRVYRIALNACEPTKPTDYTTKTPAELSKLLRYANPYIFRTALQLLHESKKPHDGEILALARRQALHSTGQAAVQGLFGMIALGEEPGKFAELLLDVDGPTNDVRAMAARWLGEQGNKSAVILTKAAAREPSPTVRRELASAALRLGDKGLTQALLSHKGDAKDPVIPHLLWLAFSKVLVAAPAEPLDWLAQAAPGNPLLTDEIVPRTMRRLLATGKAEDSAACLAFVEKVNDKAVRLRALEGMAIALANRQIDAPAWPALRAKLLADDPAAFRGLTAKLDVAFRDVAAAKRALALANDAAKPVPVRCDALRDLALLKPVEGLPSLLRLVKSDGPAEIRVEALRALGGYEQSQIAGDLLANWPSLPPAVRAEAVTLLASRKAWAKELLTAMSKKIVDRRDVNDNAITRIRTLRDKELNALVESAWGRIRETPAELNKLIDRTRGSLYEAAASYARGRVVFENQCAKCHKFEGRGHEVGPPLDGAGRDIEYLLVNVLDPNRVIGAPYFQRILALNSGKVETGIVASEDEQSITLKAEGGVLKVIAKKEIAESEVVEKSLMPEGLSKGMSEQDFRDLVRYVMAHPFLTNVKVNGKSVKVGVPGLIGLPATEKEATAEVIAEFSATVEVKTQLLLGGPSRVKVWLDGNPLGEAMTAAQPDSASLPVALSPGKHMLRIEAQYAGKNAAIFARLLDPDRKLRQADFE